MTTLKVYPTHIEVVDADDAVAGAIDSAFSWDEPGAFFAKRTHLKKHPTPQSWCSFCHWDGKKHVFSDGKLPLGFRNKLTTLLDEIGAEYEVSDLRPPTPSKQYDWHCSTELRDYQNAAVQSMKQHGMGIVEAATGAGKSIICAAAICELGLPAVVVVPTKMLLGQFVETFTKHTDIPVGVIGSGKYVDSPVQIAIAKSLTTDDPVHPDVLTKDVLCIDEMHYSSAATWGQIISNCPAHYRFGFSATPYKDTDLEDNMLVGMCGEVIFRIGVKELQDEGHLSQTEIRVIHVKCGYERMLYDDELNERGLPMGWRETHYAEKYRAGIVENQYGNEQIAAIVNHHANQGQKVLVIIQQIDHAETLCASFEQDAIFINGDDTAKQTEAKRLEFRGQDGGICIGTSVVDTGMDVPSIDVLVLVAGGDFDGRAIQRIGRGLRPSPGKDKVIVYDIRYDDKPMFWYHGKERIAAYKKIGQEVTEYETFDDVLAAEKRQQKQLALGKR